MDTEPRLKKLIADHLGIGEEEIARHSSFRDDLGADSMDRVELTMNVEDEFNIVITDEEAVVVFGETGDFGKLLDLVERKLAKVAV